MKSLTDLQNMRDELAIKTVQHTCGSSCLSLAVQSFNQGFDACHTESAKTITALLEIIEEMQKSLIYYSKEEFDRVCFLDHSTCEQNYGADARQTLTATEQKLKELTEEK